MRILWMATLSVILISCSGTQGQVKIDKSVSKEERNIELPPHFIQDELIIKLALGIRPADLVSEFEELGLEYKDVIAEISLIYLFTYDTEMISPHEVLDKVREHQKVLLVEFNKRLEMRD